LNFSQIPHLVIIDFLSSELKTNYIKTELIPRAKASIMSAYYASAGPGRVIGVISGGLLWEKSGIVAVSRVYSACTFVALMTIIIGLRKFKKTR